MSTKGLAFEFARSATVKSQRTFSPASCRVVCASGSRRSAREDFQEIDDSLIRTLRAPGLELLLLGPGGRDVWGWEQDTVDLLIARKSSGRASENRMVDYSDMTFFRLGLDISLIWTVKDIVVNVAERASLASRKTPLNSSQ